MSQLAQSAWRYSLCGLALTILAASVGCQVDIGGQLHPSPYYLSDDVQYFPPGQEFKLPREAAAIQQYAAEQRMQQGR
jgi:hypothetical protein